MDPKVIWDDFLNVIRNHYFDMKGRVRRYDFWTFVLAATLVLVAVTIVASFLPAGGILNAVAGFALLLPMAGMGARRLQDADKDGRLVWAVIIPNAINLFFNLLYSLSGPYGPLGTFYDLFPTGLINLVGFVAVIACIYFWVQDGTPGPNKYGADPKGRTAPAAA